jgi:broad specificity phosphatase PhoE
VVVRQAGRVDWKKPGPRREGIARGESLAMFSARVVAWLDEEQRLSDGYRVAITHDGDRDRPATATSGSR